MASGVARFSGPKPVAPQWRGEEGVLPARNSPGPLIRSTFCFAVCHTRGKPPPSVCGLPILHALRSIIREKKKKRKDKTVPVISGTLQRTLSAGQAKHASHSGRVLLLLLLTSVRNTEYSVNWLIRSSVIPTKHHRIVFFPLSPTTTNLSRPSRLFPLSSPEHERDSVPNCLYHHTPIS